MLVPNAAVTAGKVSVRGKDGQVTERNVVVGRSDGQSVEIRRGLSEGEEVIIPGKT
jgi:multidrug efflux pump subunit AcrA (membrane-fusion protein)